MQREERKKHLIKDFTIAFSENGIDRTSIKKLAKAADINEASIYQYFKNKDDIIVECVRQYFSNIEDGLFPVVADPAKPLHERLAYVLSYSGEMAGPCNFVCQVIANPLYSRMCEPIIGGFLSGIRAVGDALSAESGIGQEEIMPIVFLYLGAVSMGRIINDDKTLLMQTDYLEGILKSRWQGGGVQ